MPPPRRVAGVSVGVNNTGVLQTLTAAASSAIGFHKWLLSQRSVGVDVESTALTDSDGSHVTYRDVVDAAKKIVDQRSCDALFLYFCGHGVMPNPYEEHFLLSDVKSYETEAVNLNQSIQDAKYCGLNHVVIVYDACRTSAEGDLRRIGGKSIIKPISKVQPGHVDVFMACGPDQSAYLIPRAKQAFFTGILLDILRATPPEIVEEYHPQAIYMIPSKRLERLLYREVPKLAGAANPPFDQTPAIGSQSDLPECFAVVGATDVKQGEPGDSLPPPPDGPPRPSDVVQWYADRLLPGAPAADQMSSELRKVAQTSGFDQAVQMTNLAKGRDGFETHTGFTVIGAKVKRAWTSGQRNRESTLEPDYLNPEVTHVPVGDPPWDVGSGTAIIELQNGGGLVLGIIPGYVGTVVIRDSAIAALAYAPSRDTMLYEYYKRDEQAIRERRAFATAAASVAQIQQLAKSEHLTLDVGFDEGFDPILGILAAYAYYLADNTRKIREVFKRMSYTPFIPFPFTSVPFDVAMLAGELGFEKPPGHIASCCPLFSFGWSLLDRLNVALPGRIREAGKHRLPGLWAAFDKEGIGFFQEALDKGEIS